MADDYQWVGKSPLRIDTKDKIRGQAVYIDDLKLPGMLYGKVLRSRYPHAIILGIDTYRAEKLPGVRGVVIGTDIPYQHGEALLDKPFLAIEKVRYAGEGLAAVAAIDEQTAEAAIGLITVEYDELPAVFDPLRQLNRERLSFMKISIPTTIRPISNP